MSAARTLRNQIEPGRMPAKREPGSSRTGAVHTFSRQVPIGGYTLEGVARGDMRVEEHETYNHQTKGRRWMRVS